MFNLLSLLRLPLEFCLVGGITNTVLFVYLVAKRLVWFWFNEWIDR